MSFARTPGYAPVPAEERTYQGPKYSGRKGQYFGHHWLDDLELLPDDERVVPETRPDDEAADHRWGCGCLVCQRPQARKYKRRRLKAAAAKL